MRAASASLIPTLSHIPASEPGGVERWCVKGTAKRFDYTVVGPALVDVAAKALHLASAEARATGLSVWAGQTTRTCGVS